MTILNPKEITSKDLERKFFEIGCEIAKELMEEFLEGLDHQLAANKDKKESRHGGKKQTTQKTLMGEIAIKRNIYGRIDEDGQMRHLYLLDQALGFEAIGLISSNLAEKILELSCRKPYAR